jgi:hypothetical protein
MAFPGVMTLASPWVRTTLNNGTAVQFYSNVKQRMSGRQSLASPRRMNRPSDA